MIVEPRPFCPGEGGEFLAALDLREFDAALSPVVDDMGSQGATAALPLCPRRRPRLRARATPSPEPSPVLAEGALVEMEPDVTPPKGISGQTATYPVQARRLRQSGPVAVRLMVDAQASPRT